MSTLVLPTVPAAVARATVERLLQPDGDLVRCDEAGVAWQTDMAAGRVTYDDAYLDKVLAYEGTAIAAAVNRGRCALLKRHLPAGASVLDIGAGSGAFVRDAAAAGFSAYGYEVMPAAADRLRAIGLYAETPAGFDAVSMWDVIEHVADPDQYLERIPVDALLFASVPVVADLSRIRESKHYRPGEHLYYWTAGGFIGWLMGKGFHFIEQSDHETDAGRESIGAFAFRRVAAQ